ncbi:hypothetical protein PCANC_09073 [Puccinia coronata f. sp. avenae]|uniref:Uncharacterized protein n=1 Tax=Puccinia coronata f. sp. avenae TaxID=200324 RepID=A0A2N5TH10_9BASI|nr:hypothetical protein PCANC_09073 [Puccinia coronata f. sp. avenae]PLW24773.1 hypothetical protein PCASD_05203 [Puccinia coronata f. sp. avenae]
MRVDKQPASASSNEISHLFWPSDHPLDAKGYLVGSRIGTLYAVATLAPFSQSISDLDRCYKHSAARLIGQLNPLNDTPSRPSPAGGDEDWITIIYNGTGTIQINASKTDDETIVVLYDRPSMRKHHFLSLRPLLKPSLVSTDSSSSPSSSSSSSAAAASKHNENEELAHKIVLFDRFFPHHAMPGVPCGHPREMSKVIEFVNSSEEMHTRLLHFIATQNVKPKPVHSSHLAPHPSRRPLFPYRLDSILALSTFLQQLNVRMVEISSWPSRYRKITREEDGDLSGRRAEYVMLFNTLWLVANDIIFGRATGAILMQNCDLLAAWLEYHLQMYTVTLIKRALRWTNSYPVGLKLNDQLGQAFCLCANMTVDFWHIHVLKHAYLILPKMIWTAGLVSLFGSTFALAVASDLLTIATFHLWIIYRVFTVIFDCQLRFLSVLFNIFRGRKYNVLRNRNEPAMYQLDQLILGTIFFTLAIFLFPTILAFYMLTSTTRVVIVWTHGIIGTGLSLLNHFPLFVVMLRFKDPARLPSGVCFVPVAQGPAHFKLKNKPVGLAWIFSDYISLWANLTAHYSPRLLLYHLCTGMPIAPLPTRAAAYKRP